jgi:hypothetical protein
MWPQHSDVVGDGFGIGRAHTDVDHGDAAAVCPHQMIGRHLWQAGRRFPKLIARLDT